ncbi:protein-disulfide reductase DsbD [Pigmentiphaga aceris]|uniref:Thiol:disulfide interchange protein DsbD n=1 Tax=Pigmentiphaga aceris TaxID=1940612 RepID=A0A5C0B2H1_9BURK|nr:protein-disulfide reductase DsbD [Pigmentiphaga aceris]QEI08742.1 protein-disulfide reductase DsbD [Pigmentiphaga aceris]
MTTVPDILLPSPSPLRAPFQQLAARLSAALMLLCLVVGVMTASLARAEDFLPPEEAFRFSAQLGASGDIEVQFKIAPGYYMYREQFAFSTEPAAAMTGPARIPAGKIKFDETFQKDVETLRDTITIMVPVNMSAMPFTLLVRGQGCADAGLCYQPQDYRVPVAGGKVDDGRSVWSTFGSLLGANDISLSDALSRQGAAQTILVFFVLGVLLALTPCVLPMMPILSAILVGDRVKSSRPRLRGLGLAALYVLGMSLVYTLAGVAAGLSGEGLAAALQTPWVLGIFAALLVVLALAMFDVFTLQVPASWQTALSARASAIPGGRATGAFAMGAISALIVGPCVAAPLAGALLYISQTRDVVLGGAALFALAWGMGVPLLVAGASAGALLPRAGAWMDGVKRFFGVLLLAVAWWMLAPVLPAWLAMGGWAALAILSATLLRAFDSLPAEAGFGRRVGKALGILFALLGVLQAVGLASGGRDPWQPLVHLTRVERVAALPPVAAGSAKASPFASALAGGSASADSAASSAAPGAAPTLDQLLKGTPTQPATGQQPASGQHAVFTRIKSVADLDAIVAASDRPVMLDFYADWCVSCKEMEAFTFPDPNVAAQMAQMRVVQADVTANDAQDRELLKRFRLFGPPGIIFFDANGRELHESRVIGFQNARRFGDVLTGVLRGS